MFLFISIVIIGKDSLGSVWSSSWLIEINKLNTILCNLTSDLIKREHKTGNPYTYYSGNESSVAIQTTESLERIAQQTFA